MLRSIFSRRTACIQRALIEGLESRQLMAAAPPAPLSIDTNVQVMDDHKLWTNLSIVGTSAAEKITLTLSMGRKGPQLALKREVNKVLVDNTRLTGSYNSVYITGQGGNDTITFKKVAGAVLITDPRSVQGSMSVSVNGGSGSDTIYMDAPQVYIPRGEYVEPDVWSYADGGSGNDILRAVEPADYDAGDANLYGGSGNDKLYGASGNDFIFGGTGNDLIEGGDGGDVMGGEDGDDIVRGGNGYNHFYLSAGTDTLVGGEDYDLFEIRRPYDGQRPLTPRGTIDGGDGENELWYNQDSDLVNIVITSVDILTKRSEPTLPPPTKG
ncbi:hypothetical protein KW782_01775 [Candidatus Parcubacteria bacterium]|nr:hypothetical protein [Candidatus Parcubacteria bacterium]